MAEALKSLRAKPNVEMSVQGDWTTLEDNAVNNEDQGERLSSRLPVVAILLGLIAAFMTAGVVSWSTPDGNLVVTLVPALAVGLTVFGLALRRVGRGGSK